MTADEQLTKVNPLNDGILFAKLGNIIACEIILHVDKGIGAT